MGNLCGSSANKTGASQPKKGTHGNTVVPDKGVAKLENQEFQSTIKALGKVPVVRMLPRSEHSKLAAIVTTATFKEGNVIFRQGEVGSDLYILKSGSAKVQVNEGGQDKDVATLTAGDYFGEGGLLSEEPRAATVLAITDVVAMKISRKDFNEMGLNDKLVFARRVAVAPGKAVSNRPPTPKDDDVAKLIEQALRSNANLNSMVNLTPERISDLVQAAWKEDVANGTAIITEGDLNADFFYIVSKGQFEVTVSFEESLSTLADDGSPKSINLGAGDSFGELALLYLAPRAATVTARTDSEVFVIHRDDFKNTLMKVSQQKVEEYVGYLNNVELLEPLLGEEKKALAKALVEMDFRRDDVILKQGEPGHTFHILYQGEVEVKVDGETQVRLRATPTEVKFFGERALLTNEPRAATLTVTTEQARTLVVDRESFDLLLGPLKDILESTTARGGHQSSVAPRQKFGGVIPRQQLEYIGLLGCGGFGFVELWEDKASEETYALKGISKGYIMKTKMQESVLNEKNIMSMVNSPFIIQLYETYNGKQSLYFLMEPALGGELFSVYNKKGLHGSLKHAKFYAAGTACALEHMHERRIIYRDLKPENILFTATGQYKLTDMGLAKFVIGKTFTTCGTPDYFAPEVINNTGQTSAVDWWCLGVLIFELLTGQAPFEAANPMQIYARVREGIGAVTFPLKAQGQSKAIIQELLMQAPSERIPMRPGGKDLLRQHQWFKGFDWVLFESLRMEAPYKPTVTSPKDASNFSVRKEEMPPAYLYQDPKTGWDADFATI